MTASRLTAVSFLAVAVLMLALPAGAQLTAGQQKQILELHNQERCIVTPSAAAMPTMVWDFRLASVAQNYANTCPGLVHNPARNTQYAALGGSGQVGENLAVSTGGSTPAQLFSLWANEKAYYTFATNSCAVGQQCGHYTQIVWASSVLVGCGMSTGCTTGGWSQVFVCNYAPAGNFPTQPYTSGSGANASCSGSRGDYNADRVTDIVLRNYSTGQNAVWRMSGTALVGISDLPALTNTSWRIEGTADFNFNGSTDVLLRNYATGQNAVWLMSGTSLSSIVDLPALPNTDFHIEGVADFNSDGKPDIILRNYVTGQNALWLMNGTALASIVDLPALTNTSYRIESAGDFNGDGRTDIVLRNYTTGQNAVWLMSGTVLQAIADLPALVNPTFRIDAVGDFNSDLRPDIVWRNYLTGQNAVWLMNGTNLGSINDLPALTNVSFEINGPR